MISGGKEVALVDVREPFEFEIARIPNSQLIPLGTIPARLAEIPRTETTVVMCKSGVRSARAIEFLREQGFENLLNLEGGLDAWNILPWIWSFGGAVTNEDFSKATGYINGPQSVAGVQFLADLFDSKALSPSILGGSSLATSVAADWRRPSCSS